MGEACNLRSEKLTFQQHCHGISDSLSCHRCAGTFSDLGLDTSAACGRRLHLMRTFGERCGLWSRCLQRIPSDRLSFHDIPSATDDLEYADPQSHFEHPGVL